MSLSSWDRPSHKVTILTPGQNCGNRLDVLGDTRQIQLVREVARDANKERGRERNRNLRKVWAVYETGRVLGVSYRSYPSSSRIVPSNRYRRS